MKVPNGHDSKCVDTAAFYPRMYYPTYALGACVLALVFASAFSVIFPLMGPAVVILLLLTLVGK